MEMKPINRNVLVIRPKKAMLDWVSLQSDQGEELKIEVDGHDQSNIYLVKETDTIEATLKWLHKNFKEIFAEELYNWWTDESVWPPLTWESFETFCDFRIHTCVYDTQRGGIQYQ